MTVTIYPAPDPITDPPPYVSTRFAATVNGDELIVLSYERITEWDLPFFWDLAESVEVSFVTYATDEVTDVVVSWLSGPITSFYVFPRALEAKAAIVGGNLVLTGLEPRDYMRIEVNDERARCLFVRPARVIADPTPGPDVIVYDGTQLSAPAGKTLWFQPGIYDLTADAWGDIRFPVEAGATVHLSGGAWVIGTFDTRSNVGWTVLGHGVMSGEFITHEEVFLLPTFEEQFVYTMILGHVDGVFPTGCQVGDITITAAPFYSIADAANDMSDVMLVTPWTANSDGLKGYGDPQNDYIYTIQRCLIWIGDDAVDMHPWRGNAIVRNNILSTSGSSCFLHGYYAAYDTSIYSALITDNVVRSVCYYYFAFDEHEGGAVIQAWTDGYENLGLIGVWNVTYRGLRVETDAISGVQCMLMNMGNKLYPWGTPRDRNGILKDFIFEDIWVETDPDFRSRIYGLDVINGIHGFAFTNLVIGDVLVTVRNYSTYFNVEDFVYFLSFGGRNVTTSVDICNIALGHIGNKARVTSIDPVDGSTESTKCAQLLPVALYAVLSMHPWSWTVAKAELDPINVDVDGEWVENDDEAWQWRYVIPEGMHRAISVIPDDSTNDYLVGDTKIPVDFAIKRSNEDGELRIYTNQEDAFLRYTVYETDPNVWDSLFTLAVTWHLASLLAGPLIKGEQGHAEAQRCLQRLGQYLGEAKIQDSYERQTTVERRSKWTAGR